MNTGTREQMRQKARIRAASMTLHPVAAWHLFPPIRATALIEYAYDIIAEQCSCKTRGHRRKDCVLNGQGKCRSCGAYTTDTGAYPLRCPGCDEWEETRIEYLGQWALENDDREGRPAQTIQASLFAADKPFDFSDVPRPIWPFNWSRRPMTYVGPENICAMCGETDAPGSYEWENPQSLTLRWTCTPCKYLANSNTRIDEGPINSIEQAQEVIAGRNRYGLDISEFREPFRKEKEPETPRAGAKQTPIHITPRERVHTPKNSSPGRNSL